MAFLPGAVADESAFTEALSPVTPAGGVFNDALPAVASGVTAQFRITESRAAHVNLRNEAGTEIGTAANPLPAQALLYDAAGNPISSTAGALDVNVAGLTGTLDENLIQLAGNAIDTDAGAKSAGTQRIVIATDQPILTNALKISATALPLPTGAATAAKQPALGTAGTPSADVITVQGRTGMTALNENVTQLAGTAIDVNSGNKSAGTQRIVLATDQPTLTNSLPISLIGDGAQTGNIYPNWKANRVALADIATGTTTTGTILTGNPGYFIDGFSITIDPQSTRAGGSNLLITLIDSSFGNVFQTSFFVPNAVTPPTVPFFAPQLLSPPNFRWNNKTANSTLSLTINASITANIHIVVNYGLTSIVN